MGMTGSSRDETRPSGERQLKNVRRGDIALE